MKRKEVSKRTRFEVFKRDAFTCQYCGAHPPSVVLHCDHIVPKASGGSNDMDNLITACMPCNLGKSDVHLSEIPQSLSEKAKSIKERELQIKGYQDVLDSRRIRVESEVGRVCNIYELNVPGFTPTEKARVSIRRFIQILGVHEVMDSMEATFSRFDVKTNNAFKYFCGICWRKIRELDHG